MKKQLICLIAMSMLIQTVVNQCLGGYHGLPCQN